MQSLGEFRPWSVDSDDLSSQLVLVLESDQVFGEFAWTLLLVKALKGGMHVRLLLLNHDKAHFDAVLRKHGIGMTGLETSGALRILELDGCKYFEKRGWDDECACFMMDDTSLSPYALFVDSLDCFDILADSSSSARKCFADCFDWLGSGKIISMVLFGRNSIVNIATAADSDPSLVEYMKYRADVVVSVTPLQSGYSADIGGRLAVSMDARRKTQTFTFKALDTGVKCSLIS